jgi:DnaJ-class molecular chaperone
MNYYSILGVTPSASKAEIKKKYDERALEMFRDELYNQGRFSPLSRLALENAFRVLSDPIKRRDYDQSLQNKESNK